MLVDKNFTGTSASIAANFQSDILLVFADDGFSVF